MKRFSGMVGDHFDSKNTDCRYKPIRNYKSFNKSTQFMA